MNWLDTAMEVSTRVWVALRIPKRQDFPLGSHLVKTIAPGGGLGQLEQGSHVAEGSRSLRGRPQMQAPRECGMSVAA